MSYHVNNELCAKKKIMRKLSPFELVSLSKPHSKMTIKASKRLMVIKTQTNN